MFDFAWRNLRLATLQGGDAGLIEDGAFTVRDGRIAWVGASRDLPRGDGPVHEGGGRLATPGLVDCHTHLVFAGHRAREFEMRLNGARYEDIARAGGGIMSTVRATRSASEDALVEAGLPRIRALAREGVTTVEIKSGYGLTADDELKMLRAARRLGESAGVSVRTTLLAAHAVPPEYQGRSGDYVGLICDTIIPAARARGLADAVDAFCETIGFTPAETRRVFDAARDAGLPVKLHAEQLSNQAGAALVAGYRGLSADHLEYLDEAGARAMAAAGSVAVLLPAAFYFLRETRLPPVDLLRREGVPMAVASDLNPGTAPVVSLLAAMHMAATLFRLTPIEVLRGVTVNGARALGLADRGVLAPGMRADACIWDLGEPAELCYWMGGLAPHAIIAGGRPRIARDNP